MSSMKSPATIRPVILAGGAGTRLWPMSRAASPKHLLPLIGDTSLFEQTKARFPATDYGAPIIVANVAQKAALEALVGEEATLLLEPVKRDSAPAIILAALAADEGDLLLVCPSDHHIGDVDAFHAAIARAAEAAKGDAIVTFGIEPDHPATGYGYIAAAAIRPDGSYQVERFVEKPAEERARAMIAAGGHYWNAGIFLARRATWIAAFEQHAPDMLNAARAALETGERDKSTILLGEEAFARSPALSVDYAIMEKYAAIAVVPVSMGWSDIGSWESLLDASPRDGEGNSIARGARAWDSKGTLIRTTGPRVAAIGADNLVIVATHDAILVVTRERTQQVREAAAWFEAEQEEKGQ